MKSFKRSAAFFLPFLLFTDASFSEPAKDRQTAVVEAAVTGDTVRLKGGKILRYAGLEAYSPESKIPLAREYGTRAQQFNHELVGGKKIFIEWGPKLRDKQNRLLGYAFLEDGRFVNGILIREGHAKVRVTVPNVQYAEQFRDWQSEARQARKGLWEKEPPDPNAGKRYIGEKNTKIYYLPDSSELERIPEAQLVYFNSRVDAKAAGYRACHSCRNEGAQAEEE